MTQYQPLEIDIRRDQVRFRIQDEDFYSTPDFLDQSLINLREKRYQTPEDYAIELFRCVFEGQKLGSAVTGIYRLRYSIDRDASMYQIRLNIDINDPHLHGLWWECLLDPRYPNDWLGRSYATPLSRYMSLTSSRKLKPSERIRILIVVSNPKDLTERWPHLPRIDTNAELQFFHKLRSNYSDRAEFHLYHKPASLNKINQLMQQNRYHVLHIIAHGNFGYGKGSLLLEKDDDETCDTVRDHVLAELMTEMEDLQLVILATCHSAERSETDAFSGLAPALVRSKIPAVIAMQDQVSQVTARKFAETFYSYLLSSSKTMGRIDVSVNAARRDLFFSNRQSWDWAIPVLFLRGDGILFESSSQVEQPKAAVNRVGRVMHVPSSQVFSKGPTPMELYPDYQVYLDQVSPSALSTMRPKEPRITQDPDSILKKYSSTNLRGWKGA